MIIRTRTLLAATRLHEYPPTDIGVRAELEAGNLAPTQLSAGPGESANKTPSTLARCHLRPARPTQPRQASPRPLTPSHGATSDRPASAADTSFAKTPYTLARWRFPPARPAQPTQTSPTPLAPSHGGTPDRPGRHSRRKLRQDPLHPPTVPLPTAWPTQPMQTSPRPLAPSHGATSGRHSRRRLRQNPLHPGTVALPTGPAGTADACSANTPCTVAR
jgi:hypothetical protein